MDAGTVGVFIPIIALSIPIVAIWAKHRQKIAEMQIRQAELLSQRPSPAADQVQALEERVRVLERIVTDGGYDVASQIEALRDSRQDEDRPENARDPVMN